MLPRPEMHKGMPITDYPDGTTSTVPCWTYKIEYGAWHRPRCLRTLLSVF